MRKTQKKVLGAFGLSVVAATTVFAAFLPTPDTQAISSLTDTITVRVVGPGPDVTIDEASSGESFVSPDKTIHYDYSGSRRVLVTLRYTNAGDETTTTTLADFEPDYAPGSGELSLNLFDPELGFGYGDYTLTVTGYGTNGFEDIDVTDFSFVPVTAEAEESNTVDGADVTLQYDPESEDIDSFEINVYDSKDNLIKGLSPLMVARPNTTFSLDFGKYGLDDGIYTIAVTALGEDGEPLYKPYLVDFNYVTEPYAVPNTGGVFQGLNISQTDYLITGLIAFGIISVAGFFFLAKNGSRQSAKRNGRRK